ncbi:MAG: winged helix-turn-helix domain-containing protein [Anaerolineales bacterium]|nr:winged helix-turn-helix domain-containing protein [Anaerolineales bacterium]
MPLSEPTPYVTDNTDQKHQLTRDDNMIGRSVDNHIVITSKRVSRQHAKISPAGRSWMLDDLGSANGTFLNDERVLAPVVIRDGDKISIGDLDFTFHDPEATIRDDPFPELEVDLPAGVVRIDRKKIDLSPKEFTLITYLHEHHGEVCSKDDISTAVWPEYQGEAYDYQIENLIRRLRTKLEPDPANPQILLTIRGLGYKLITRL